jgi:hypothetical protein
MGIARTATTSGARTLQSGHARSECGGRDGAGARPRHQHHDPDGQEWRSAMINAPVFAVSTPQAFYELLLASGSKDANAMPAFIGAHPEFAKFGDWAGGGTWTGSYAEERFNSLNSFIFTDHSAAEHAVVAHSGGAGGRRAARRARQARP